MQLTYDILLILHIVCWAIVIGGWLTSMRDPRVVPGVFHGVLGALVTGVAMTGIASASDSVTDVDNTKIGVKLIIALVVAVLAYIGQRDKDVAKPALFHAVGALAVVNVCIAVLWT